MNDKRRGEIALKMVQKLVLEDGLPGGNQLKRDLGNEAKKLDIELGELLDFYRSLLPLVLGQMFDVTAVTVIMRDKNGTETTSSVWSDR